MIFFTIHVEKIDKTYKGHKNQIMQKKKSIFASF